MRLELQISPKDTKSLVIPAVISSRIAEQFGKEIDLLCRNFRGSLELDCSELGNIVSGHIEIIWQARVTCEQAGVDIALKGVSGNLARVLKVLDISDLFKLELVDEDKTAGEFTRTFQMSPERNFELTFGATENDIDSALCRFLDYIRGFIDSDTCMFEVRTIFYEIATNIRTHSVHNDNSTIKFMAIPDPGNKLIMRFMDPGPPFNPIMNIPNFDPQTAINKRQRRGFGLILVNRMTDNITYERRNGEFNILTLEKKWE